jgi:predicted amidohydrolase YtcJ
MSAVEAINSYTADVEYQLSGVLSTPLSTHQTADFVVLDTDLRNASAIEIRQAKVLATYKNANKIYDAAQSSNYVGVPLD